ncbi:hypothetical protein B0H17DRAFT_1135933 [Mycena rosella]|uniref:Uncharacterized protein n=1 Tax=Mycena rosella TaxID=1033263 RepID=A0AAD7DEZ6_MYCRO|nr:hypothetical protein B0H17DRAFT_1135933 [Mycena rosella]
MSREVPLNQPFRKCSPVADFWGRFSRRGGLGVWDVNVVNAETGEIITLPDSVNINHSCFNYCDWCCQEFALTPENGMQLLGNSGNPGYANDAAASAARLQKAGVAEPTTVERRHTVPAEVELIQSFPVFCGSGGGRLNYADSGPSLILRSEGNNILRVDRRYSMQNRS